MQRGIFDGIEVIAPLKVLVGDSRERSLFVKSHPQVAKYRYGVQPSLGQCVILG